MKKSNITLFILLFVASISAGMALKNIFDYSMTIEVGLASIFLLAAAFSLGKKNRENRSRTYMGRDLIKDKRFFCFNFIQVLEMFI